MTPKFKKEDIIVTYFERVLYKYGEVPGCFYWHYKEDGTPWEDNYDGLFWQNTDIPKPSKQELDSIDADLVREKEYLRRETLRKQNRNDSCKNNHAILAALDIRNYKLIKKMSLEEFLDDIERE